MFGKIIDYDKNLVHVENLKKVADTNYIGFHVVFDEKDHKIIGEISKINTTTIFIQLIGEINNGFFSNGCLNKPSYNTIPRIIYKSELECILGKQDYLAKENLFFGYSPVYKNYVVTSSLNTFFANHFSVIGNTGSGKSCGLTRLLQNVFFTSNSDVPKNAHVCLFDVYGEYYDAFNEMNNLEGLHFKKYTTEINFGSSNFLNFPAYLLDEDDLAILLGATDVTQVPVLKKTIQLVKIFTSSSPAALEYKNDIIASCLLDILSSGKAPNQLRDQTISILTSYNTETLNLDSPINIPGYNRTLRQCLHIDEQGKINALKLVIDFLQSLRKVDIKDKDFNENVPYTLADLYSSLEFALISEGSLTSSSAFDKNNVLKARLQSIINSNQNKFFETNGEYVSKMDYVQNFFKTGTGDEVAQLVDVNLSFIDDKLAKALTKIFSRLFFTYTTELEHRGSYPIHIILEEAHRYVQNDTDTNIIGYNIFDRITKEGRKYGTIIGFVTQRPSELSKTALSQCSNFIVFRLFFPDDLNMVKSISANVTDETIEQVKTLHPGMGLVFGTAFKVPILCRFPLPDPLPVSTSLQVDTVWYQENGGNVETGL